MFDLPPEALAATILTTQRVARAVKKAFDAPGMMIAQLNGRPPASPCSTSISTSCRAAEGIDLRFHARDMADPKMLADHAARVRAALD